MLLHRPKTSTAAGTARSSSPARATSSAGAHPNRSCNRAPAPGGTRCGSGSARRRSAPSTAGCSSTTASRRPSPAISTGSGLALLDLDEPTRVLRRLPTGCSRRSRPYERTGDVPNVVFPCGLHPRPRQRRGPALLRRRRQLDLSRHRATSRPARRRARRTGRLLDPRPCSGNGGTAGGAAGPGRAGTRRGRCRSSRRRRPACTARRRRTPRRPRPPASASRRHARARTCAHGERDPTAGSTNSAWS